MKLVALTIKGISYSQTQSGAYALVLTEMLGSRTLPIIIGAFEAQAITIALEKEIRPPRPLTHDLFKTLCEDFQIRLEKTIIHRLVDGVFFSNLICSKDGEPQEIDARTSDAIALAVRFNAPIYTTEEILEKAGIILDQHHEMDDENMNEEDQEKEEVLDLDPYQELDTKDSTLSTFSLKELNQQLSEAIGNEQYELAALIRDEINKRTS